LTDLFSGGGSGFGAAISELFSAQGANVLVADINVEGGEKVASKNKNMTFFKLDVTSRSDWDKAVKECVDKWAKIDILVNNAVSRRLLSRRSRNGVDVCHREQATRTSRHSMSLNPSSIACLM